MDSGTFINSSQRMGFPPKVFIDSDTDQDIPPHIPILEDHCRTCLTEKVRCSCHPKSDWSGELIDITQPDPPNPDNNKDRDDVQDQALPSNWTDQDNFWLGKTYDKAGAQSSLKPVPPDLPSKEMRTSSGVSICTHITIELRLHCRSHHPNLLQVGPRVLGPTLLLIK